MFLLGSTLNWEHAYYATVATQSGEQTHAESTGYTCYTTSLPAASTVPLHLDGRIFCGVCECVTTSSVLLMLFAATFLFYAVTGYKFRPMSANPCVYIVHARLRCYCTSFALRLTTLPKATMHATSILSSHGIPVVAVLALTGTLGYPRRTRRNCGSSKWSKLLWKTAQTCSTG